MKTHLIGLQSLVGSHKQAPKCASHPRFDSGLIASHRSPAPRSSFRSRGVILLACAQSDLIRLGRVYRGHDGSASSPPARGIRFNIYGSPWNPGAPAAASDVRAPRPQGLSRARFSNLERAACGLRRSPLASRWHRLAQARGPTLDLYRLPGVSSGADCPATVTLNSICTPDSFHL